MARLQNNGLAARLRSAFSIHRMANVSAFIGLYLLGWWIYRDFSVTVDEPIHLTRVPQYFQQWREILSSGGVRHIDGGMRYGVVFNMLAHPFIVFFSENNRYVLRAYEIKHLVTFHVSLLMYGALAYAFSRLHHFRYSGLVAVMIVATFPSLFGHSFFNPKDAPFAAVYTFSGVVLAARCVMLAQRLRTGASWRYFAAEGAVTAVIIMLCAGIRIGGLALAPAWLLMLALNLGLRNLREQRERLAVLLLSAALCSVGLLLFIYPSAISHPLGWFVTTVRYLNDGAIANWGIPPRSYLPAFFFIKMPVPWFLAGLAGFALFFMRYSLETPVIRNIGAMLAAQLLLIPHVMVLARTEIHNDERHFLFMFPAYCFFVGYAFITALRACRRRLTARLLALAFALASLRIAGEMILLHPYQYIYFNEATRYDAVTRYKPNGYWNGGAKALFDWINAHRENDAEITSTFDYYRVPGDLAVILYANREFNPASDPQRKLAAGYKGTLRHCRMLHQETRRQGDRETHMGGVFDCSKE